MLPKPGPARAKPRVPAFCDPEEFCGIRAALTELDKVLP
jgi:hypothetical protein